MGTGAGDLRVTPHSLHQQVLKRPFASRNFRHYCFAQRFRLNKHADDSETQNIPFLLHQRWRALILVCLVSRVNPSPPSDSPPGRHSHLDLIASPIHQFPVLSLNTSRKDSEITTERENRKQTQPGLVAGQRVLRWPAGRCCFRAEPGRLSPKSGEARCRESDGPTNDPSVVGRAVSLPLMMTDAGGLNGHAPSGRGTQASVSRQAVPETGSARWTEVNLPEKNQPGCANAPPPPQPPKHCRTLKAEGSLKLQISQTVTVTNWLKAPPHTSAKGGAGVRPKRRQELHVCRCCHVLIKVND